MPGVSRVELVSPPALVRNAPDNNAAAFGRMQWKVHLDPSGPLPTPTEFSASTFVLRIGYDGPLSGADADHYSQYALLPGIPDTNVSGDIIAFPLTVATVFSPVATNATFHSWRGTLAEGFERLPPEASLLASDNFEEDVETHSFNVEYEILLTNPNKPAASAWANPTSSITAIPYTAFPAHPLTNPLYIVSGLTQHVRSKGYLARPRMPVQSVLANTGGVTLQPGPDASTTTIRMFNVRVEYYGLADSSGPGDGKHANAQIGGQPAIWVTLGGHASTNPYIFAPSNTGTPYGTRVPILPGQAAVSPVIGGVSASEYSEAGTQYMTYACVQVTRYEQLPEPDPTVQRFHLEIDVPASTVQSPDMTLVNVSYLTQRPNLGVSTILVSAVPVSAAFAQSVAFGPVAAPTGTGVVPVAANTPSDTPFFLIGGTQPSSNGGPDGILLDMFVYGDAVPATAQPALTGAAAAAFDAGFTWDAALCPRGVTPTPALFDEVGQPLSLVQTEVTSVDMTPTDNNSANGGTADAGFGVPTLFKIRLTSGASAVSSAAALSDLVMHDPGVTVVTDADAVDVCVRSAPSTGGGAAAVSNAAGSGLPVSVAVKGAAVSVSSTALSFSGIVDWSDAVVPPAFRPLFAAASDATQFEANSFTDTVLPPNSLVAGARLLGGRRRHPVVDVSSTPAAPAPPHLPADLSLLSVATSMAPVSSFMTRQTTQLLGATNPPAVGALIDQQYLVQAEYASPTVVRQDGGPLVTPVPLLFGTPRLTLAGGVGVFLHADTQEAAETAAFAGDDTGGAPLSNGLASFDDLFTAPAVLRQEGAPLIPVPSPTPAPARVTIGLTPYASGTAAAIPGNDDLAYPPAVDASTLAAFDFFVTPVTYTTDSVGGAPVAALRGRDIPATATFDATAGTVEVVALIGGGDVDAFGQYNALPRQVSAHLSLSVVFGGVRFTRAVSLVPDLTLEAAAPVQLVVPPSFTPRGQVSGELSMVLSHAVVEYGVSLTASTTPTDTGVLASASAGAIEDVRLNFSNGTTDPAVVGQTLGFPGSSTLPDGLTPATSDIQLSDTSPGDSLALGATAADVLWLDTPLQGTAVQVASGDGVVVTSTITVPATSATGATVGMLLLNGRQTTPGTENTLARLVFLTPDVIVLSLFPEQLLLINIPQSATQQQREVATILASAKLTVPNAAITEALVSLASTVVPSSERALALEPPPTSGVELAARLVREARTSQVTGDALTPHQARLIAKHVQLQTTGVRDDVRAPLFVNADVATVEQLEQQLSAAPRFSR
jgi:hypothetical protein